MLNPNPWATSYKPNPPFDVDTPVPVGSVAVEAGRTTVWESVLTLVRVVPGTTVVEEITTGGPGVVTTTGGVVIGGVGVTTGGVLGVGLTLMVTGLRPNPLHTP